MQITEKQYERLLAYAEVLIDKASEDPVSFGTCGAIFIRASLESLKEEINDFNEPLDT